MYQWKQLSPSVHHRLDLGLAFGMTDTGLVRASNEDNFLIDARLGLVAVADGMGGHDAGEVASAEALTSLAQSLRDSIAMDVHGAIAGNDAAAFTTMEKAVEFANRRMYQTNLANRRGDGGGMGTTLTGVWQPQAGGPVIVFHIGDSRLYRYRDGALSQLTHDQTLYQQAVDDGIAVDLPPRNLLLQALGPAYDVEPDLQLLQVAPGDLLLLCSDGLFGGSSDAQIADVLAEATEANLDLCCEQLIENAKRDGSRDNITAVLVQCRW